MTQTQIDPDHESKQKAISLVEDEKQPTKEEPEPQKPKRRIPKPVLILGAIALLAGVGYGIYRVFFYHPNQVYS